MISNESGGIGRNKSQKYNEDNSFANGGEFTSFKEFIENENNLLNAIKLLDEGEIFTTF